MEGAGAHNAPKGTKLSGFVQLDCGKWWRKVDFVRMWCEMTNLENGSGTLGRQVCGVGSWVWRG